MTNDLFLAILAMDAYNRTGPRGTPVGLKLPGGNLIGNATARCHSRANTPRYVD